jgi:hypothetical protein
MSILLVLSVLLLPLLLFDAAAAAAEEVDGNDAKNISKTPKDRNLEMLGVQGRQTLCFDHLARELRSHKLCKIERLKFDSGSASNFHKVAEQSECQRDVPPL